MRPGLLNSVFNPDSLETVSIDGVALHSAAHPYPSGLTVSAVSMLLEIYCGDRSLGIFSEDSQTGKAIAQLVAADLVHDVPVEGRQYNYCATERGDVFAQAIMSTPLPVQKWVMPWENE